MCYGVNWCGEEERQAANKREGAQRDKSWTSSQRRTKICIRSTCSQMAYLTNLAPPRERSRLLVGCLASSSCSSHRRRQFQHDWSVATTPPLKETWPKLLLCSQTDLNVDVGEKIVLVKLEDGSSNVARLLKNMLKLQTTS